MIVFSDDSKKTKKTLRREYEALYKIVRFRFYLTLPLFVGCSKKQTEALYPSAEADSLANNDRLLTIAREARRFVSGTESSGQVAERKAAFIQEKMNVAGISADSKGIKPGEFRLAVRRAYLQDVRDLLRLKCGLKNSTKSLMEIKNGHERSIDDIKNIALVSISNLMSN